jgi:hypothetical protein
MTYSSLGTIEARDYNTRVWGSNSGTPNTSVNCLYRLWGPGFGDRGMGQDMATVPAAFDIDPGTAGVQNTAELNPVTGAAITSTSGNNVRAVQWTGLVAAINRMRFHQTSGSGSNLSIAGVSIGSTISIIPSIDSALSSASTAMGSGRLGTVIAGDAINGTWTFNSVAEFRTQTHIRTITFQDGDAARYFFNAGGRLRFRITSSTTAGSARTLAMAETIEGVGTIDVQYKTNGGMTGTTTGGPFAGAGKGYWNLGTAYLLLGRHEAGAGGAPYGDSYVEVSARVHGTAGENGDVGNSISFQVKLGSGFGATGTATGPGGSPTWATDSMNLAYNSTVDLLPPRVVAGVITNQWGTPTVS